MSYVVNSVVAESNSHMYLKVVENVIYKSIWVYSFNTNVHPIIF